jgi:hypothetical protein
LGREGIEMKITEKENKNGGRFCLWEADDWERFEELFSLIYW